MSFLLFYAKDWTDAHPLTMLACAALAGILGGFVLQAMP